jgi:hypothetical protein
MKTKKFTITENVLASQGQRFLNVIIDFSLYLHPYFECRNDYCFNRQQITLLFLAGLKT